MHQRTVFLNYDLSWTSLNTKLRSSEELSGGLSAALLELENHPWFIGVQFHPEFKSRPFTPHPLFSSFVKAAGTNGRKN